MKPGDPTPDLDQALDAGEIAYDVLMDAPAIPDVDYLHWQKLKHLTPPHGWSTRRWWFQLKWLRGNRRITVPGLHGSQGRAWLLTRVGRLEHLLHELDLVLGGRVTLPGDVLSAGERDRYIANSLMQEAIHSSLYEGAVSTVEDAKQLLRTGRDPCNHSERMIRNNYHAMLHLRTLAQPQRQLSVEDVLELHRIVTMETLKSDTAGHLQAPADQRVVVFDQRMQRVVHTPPPAEELPARMQALVAFANAPDLVDETFVHPLLRAILLHFQLAWDHPFADGNGRTARALFYWSLLRRGYWLAEFLSISRLLYQRRGAYENAFVQVETDGGDVTYFVLHQLGVLKDAVAELHRYAEHRQRHLAQLRQRLKSLDRYNHRQQELLDQLLREPLLEVSHASHGRTHGVSHVTARADLQALERDGLLRQRRHGKRLLYGAMEGLADRLRG